VVKGYTRAVKGYFVSVPLYWRLEKGYFNCSLGYHNNFALVDSRFQRILKGYVER
jgi:hypothetical protein